MQSFSLHIHSTFSDGSNSIEEIVAVAERLKLSTIGLSDHFRLSSHNSQVMLPSELQNYISTIDRLNKTHQIKILKGLEVDVPLNSKETLFYREIKNKYHFDYFIGAVHKYSCDHFIWGHFKNENMIDIAERHKIYWNRMLDIANNPIFDIIAHPDYIKSCGVNTEKYLTKEIDSFLAAVQTNHKIIELNTSGLDKQKIQDFYPSKNILLKCKDLSLPIIIGSDAHSSSDIIKYFDQAEKYLLDLNIMPSNLYALQKFKNDFLISRMGACYGH